MLTRLGARASALATRSTPWTNVVGVARTILATAGALTLAVNDTTTFFRPLARVGVLPDCAGLRGLSGFCLVDHAHLGLVRWAFVVGLLVVASGFRPRFTGILHAFIAFSVQAGIATREGGDQISWLIALLLLPVTLTDERKWHWSDPLRPSSARPYATVLAVSALWVIRLQVAGIYFHAAAGKFAATDWANGTALYYWLTHPLFGAADWLDPVVRAVVTTSFGVSLLTWGTVALEFALAAGLVMDRRGWPWLFALGVSLHGGIMLVQGLASFSSVMIAALILYLRPTEQRFAFPALLAAATRTADWLARRFEDLLPQRTMP